jgi:hypothetical protein
MLTVSLSKECFKSKSNYFNLKNISITFYSVSTKSSRPKLKCWAKEPHLRAVFKSYIKIQKVYGVLTEL